MRELDWPKLPAWMANASCAEVGGDAWFPTKGGSNERADARAAQLICRRCPVRAECLTFGIENSDGYGIWGGILPKQRRGLAA